MNDSGIPTQVIGYIKDIPQADRRLQVDAIELACENESLNLLNVFDADTQEPYTALADLCGSLFETPIDYLMVFGGAIEVFGETALEQARTVIALTHLGAEIRIADGQSPQTALKQSWSARPHPQLFRERSKTAMRNLARRTLSLGRTPYGYQAQNRTLVTQEDEAKVVRIIFDSYVSDEIGLRKITRKLNDSGYLTRRDRPWSVSSVRTILQNEVYTGVYRRSGTVIPQAHEAIIDSKTYKLANSKKQERKARIESQRSSTAVRHEYVLSNLVLCGACNSSMIGAVRTNPTTQQQEKLYRCSAATNQGRCKYRSASETSLLTAVRKVLVERKYHFVETDRRTATEFATNHARIERTDREVSAYLDRWVENRITFPQLINQAGRSTLENIFSRAEQATGPRQNSSRLITDLQTNWTSLDSLQLKDLLNAVVHHIILDTEKTTVYLRPIID